MAAVAAAVVVLLDLVSMVMQLVALRLTALTPHPWVMEAKVVLV